MKKKKDILFLLQFFYPEYISSATLPFDTASRLAQEGYEVDVLCGYPREYTDEANVPCEENVNHIHIRRVKYLQADRKKILGRMVNDLSLTVAMFCRLLEMRKYKAIMVYTNPPILPLVAALASKLFGCRLFLVAYDLYPEIALKMNVLSEKSVVAKLMHWINRFVYRQASAVVVLSSEMKDYVIQNRNIHPDQVHVIPNWFQDEYASGVMAEENPFRSVTEGRFVVGYFGNMGVAQDMQPLKEAMRHYKDDPEICFLLSGHGSKHADMEKMIRHEKITNAYLYGFLKGQEYLDALQASHCAVISLEKGLTGLCVPSKTYGYMMQGLPLIAMMGESDIVGDIRKGAGYEILDNSAEELIAVIAQLKNNVQDCCAKGKMSRQLYLDKYTPEVSLQKYLQLLQVYMPRM